MSDPFKLELQIVLSHYLGVGTEPWSVEVLLQVPFVIKTFFFSPKNVFIFYVYIYLPKYVYVHHTPPEDIGTPGTRVMGSCELPCVCWD